MKEQHSNNLGMEKKAPKPTLKKLRGCIQSLR